MFEMRFICPKFQMTFFVGFSETQKNIKANNLKRVLVKNFIYLKSNRVIGTSTKLSILLTDELEINFRGKNNKAAGSLAVDFFMC